MLAEFVELPLDKALFVLNQNEFLFKLFSDVICRRLGHPVIQRYDIKNREDEQVLDKVYRSHALFEGRQIAFVRVGTGLPKNWDILEHAHHKLQECFTVFWTSDLKVFSALTEEWKYRKIRKFELYDFPKKFDRRKKQLVQELFKFRGKEIQDETARILIDLFPDEFRLNSEIGFICDSFDSSLVSPTDIEKLYGHLIEDQDYLFDILSKITERGFFRLIRLLRSFSEVERKRIAAKIFQFIEQIMLVNNSWNSLEIKEFQNASFLLSKPKLIRLEQFKGLRCRVLMANLVLIL